MSKPIDEAKEARRLDRERRQEYITRYSKERVVWACAKASNHKSRAKKCGRVAHFTAWDWLDLCGASDFCCTYCRQIEPLEPHHRKPISAGGANTIDNIVPLCFRCHVHWHENPDDVSELWMADQQKLFEAFRVGDRVKRNYSTNSRQEGVIVQFFPPQRGSLPLRGHVHIWKSWQVRPGANPLSYHVSIYPSKRWNADTPDIVIETDYGKTWREGRPKALINWLRVIKGVEVVVLEETVELHKLRKAQKPSKK